MKFKLIILTCILSDIAFSQTAKFTWVGGSTTTGQTGSYSAKGVTHINNIPGARSNTAYWQDNANNFWFFGEFGVDAAGFTGNLSDLWKFNPTTNLWSWHKGDSLSSVNNNWGTLNVGSMTSKPAFRQRTMHWKNAAGDLFMFGGYGKDVTNGYGQFNDFWKYEIALNRWTWIGGSKNRNQVGVYSGFTNYPGSRDEGYTWTDNNGVFWLYGGIGYYTASSTSYTMSDLWKYDAFNGWTYVSGAAQRPARFGTKGVASVYNTPGSRKGGATWKDTNGNLWLFGGDGILNTTSGYLNDLWKYDITQNLWTWIAGDTLYSSVGKYGTMGVPSSTNTPGSRKNPAAWADASGNFYVFGGNGYANLTGAGNSGKLNDLWKYNMTTNEWTWLAGTNLTDQTGVYGTKNVYSPTNIPSARSNSSVWIDAAGIVWLFGGEAKLNFGGFNDLWKLDLNSTTDINDIDTDPLFELYPNPNAGSFIIHSENTIKGDVFVYDVLGKKVYDLQSALLNKLSIDLTHQPTGIYFINVVSDKKCTTKKIIINK